MLACANDSSEESRNTGYFEKLPKMPKQNRQVCNHLQFDSIKTALKEVDFCMFVPNYGVKENS